MMSLWDALRMNMMISYQELVRTFPKYTTSKVIITKDDFRTLPTIASNLLVSSSCSVKSTVSIVLGLTIRCKAFG
ncbi:hypothetical protein LPJ39_28985, partial [Klebsiella pneumoniae]|nr:hypothetical protein [Klebsiella pneumoniae]